MTWLDGKTGNRLVKTKIILQPHPLAFSLFPHFSQASLSTAPLLQHQQQSMVRANTGANGVNPLFGNPPSPLGSQAGGVGGIYAQVRHMLM